MKKTHITLSTITLIALAGCASAPEKIATQYVSPLQYQSYDCAQLSTEAERVSRRASELRGILKEKSDTDNVQMGVGLILFWPTLFFIDGDGAEAQEYSRLKGEFEAIEKTAIEKKCGLTVTSPEPTPPAPSSPVSSHSAPAHLR